MNSPSNSPFYNQRNRPFSTLSIAMVMLLAATIFHAGRVRADTTRRLFFVSDRDGNHEIYSCDANGNDVRNISQNPGDDIAPALSPDGQTVVFARDGNIWTMGYEGSHQQQLTSSGADAHPSWTPNASQIIFSSRRNGASQVFAVKPDGTALAQVVFSNANDVQPVAGDVPKLVPSPQPTVAPVAPEVVSLSPSSATDIVGATRTWTTTVKDDNGISDISSVWFMASRSMDWNAGMTLLYLPQKRQLFLRDNDSWGEPISPGSGHLESARVSVDGASVTAEPGSDGKTLTLSMAIRTKDVFAGLNSLWARVEDSAGLVDGKAGQFGFVSYGIWNIAVDDIPQAPVATVSPGGRGTTAQIKQGEESEVTLDMKDDNGAQDVESAWLKVGADLDWGQGITLVFDGISKRLYLRSTGGAQWLGGNVIGQGQGTLENEAASIRLNGCSLSPLPNGLRLHLEVTPKQALVGTQNVWTRIEDQEGNIATDADCPFGFSSAGQWQVQNASASAGWQTSFRPATTSSLSAPVNYFAWDVASQQLNKVFDWKGGIPEQAAPNPNAVWRHIGFNEDQNMMAMEFETDAPQWELYCGTGSNGWRVLVRDPGVTLWQVLGSWKPPVSDSLQVQVFHQKEGARMPRRWRIEYSSQLAIGVRVNQGDNIAANPLTVPLPRIVWCGDSYVEGVGTPSIWQGFAAQAGALLGVDSQFDASGGTGYISDGPPTWGRSHFGARIANIIQAHPAYVVIYGSTNDGSAAPQDVAVAATKFWSDLQQALPNTKIIVIGPVQPNDFWNLKPLSQALQNAATQNNVTFIDATSWINGTGHVGAARGDGNADSYISADGVHPTPAGHAYLAKKVADALRPFLTP